MPITPELLQYISEQKALGKSSSDIRQALGAAGWSPADLDQAFSPSPPLTLPPVVSSPPDPAGLPSFGELLKSTWQIFKSRWKTLFVIQLLPGIPIAVAAALFAVIAIFAFPSLLSLTSSSLQDLNHKEVSLETPVNSPTPVSPLYLLVIAPIIGIFALLTIILTIWSSIATLVAIKTREENTSWKDCFTLAWPLLGKFFVTALLSSLIILTGFILLFVPGIIWAIQLSLTSCIVVYESLSGKAAIKRSRYLTSGFRWAIFGRFFLFVILTAAIMLVFTLILGALLYLVVTASGLGKGQNFFSSQSSNFELQLPFPAFFFSIFGVLIYEHLARLKGPSQNG